MNINLLYPSLNMHQDVAGITANSKQVKPNYIFVAIKGHKNNGKKYIDEAVKLGACLIVTDQLILHSYYPYLHVKNAKKEYIRLLQFFYHYVHDIYTIGVTGTDGKTTTASILNNILNFGNASAYVGTNGIIYNHKTIKSKHTTPTPDVFYSTYEVLKQNHINDLVMEVSSEGILDKRIENLAFDGAIFTNLTHEHLNTHKTMLAYFKTKAQLFLKLKDDGLAVINADDHYARYLSYYTKAKIITYGINKGLYQAKNLKLSFNKTQFDVYYKGVLLGHFVLPLFGKYNVYNALAAIAYTYELGISLNQIKQGIETLEAIDGRFMCYHSKNKITGIVDFAHTPNALKCLLSNLNAFKKGKIIVILGAQGEKDKSKREKMGVIATTYADITIFTSEDPKNENLFGILLDLTKKITNKEYYLTLSRKQAIELACKLALENDIILITGKGNEDYEQIYDYKFKHNDYLLLKQNLDIQKDHIA